MSDAPTTNTKAAELATTLMKSVWWAIVLGLAIQIVIMIVNHVAPGRNVIPEVGQKVSWSLLVCSAMAIGNSIAKARPLILGTVGMFAAPIAFNAARIIQRGLSAGGSAGALIPAPLELSVAKALEYAVFGILIAYAAKSGRARGYLLTGLTLAIMFTIYLEMRLINGNTPSPAQPILIARGINEFLFPIGCAFVLWFTTEMGTKFTALTAVADAAAAQVASAAPAVTSPAASPAAPATGAAAPAAPGARA